MWFFGPAAADPSISSSNAAALATFSLGQAFEIQDPDGGENPAVFISVEGRRSIVFYRDTNILVIADNHI